MKTELVSLETKFADALLGWASYPKPNITIALIGPGNIPIILKHNAQIYYPREFYLEVPMRVRAPEGADFDLAISTLLSKLSERIQDAVSGLNDGAEYIAVSHRGLVYNCGISIQSLFSISMSDAPCTFIKSQELTSRV